MRYSLYTVFLFILIATHVTAQVSIIPEPVTTMQHKGNFRFNPSTKIFITNGDDTVSTIVKRFTAAFKRASNLTIISRAGSGDSNAINIVIDSTAVKNKEGYILDISPARINITAAKPAGVLYAFETLKKLLPPAFYKPADQNHSVSWGVPAAYINDYPQYPYRAMQLDVSRHFFSVQFIKKYLDLLASYKINTFHWHLTDSHGWRLEIKKYPRLTSVGAWRADRKGIPMTIAQPTAKSEPATYGGYYTQQQVRGIVRYAAERNITVIPEIEMPGHCTAALVAYPQYTDLNNKTPLLIPCGLPGDLKHNFCAGYDSTYVFLENILKEVFQLFPSKYIHIGGDEVQGGPWLNCPRCRRLMKAKGFTTTVQLQNYFTTRIDSFIVASGRQAIGWEEMLAASVSPQSIGMVWHEKTNAIPLVNSGHNLVLTPFRYTYFDFYQSDPRLEPHITYAPLYLDSVYAFDPRPAGISNEAAAHILGGQACLWTENVETPARAEYMTLPRLSKRNLQGLMHNMLLMPPACTM